MKKNNKLGMIIGISVVLILCIAIILGVSGTVGSNNQRKWQEELTLGEKYLNELFYDQAIATYESIIQIDAKCMEAYFGIAEAYEGKGDVFSAGQTLAFAYGMVEEGDREAVENEFQQLAERYEELRIAYENGEFVFHIDISEEEFYKFFHMQAENSDGEGNIYEMNVEFPLSEFDYVLFGKPLEEWTLDSLTEYGRSNFEYIEMPDGRDFYDAGDGLTNIYRSREDAESYAERVYDLSVNTPDRNTYGLCEILDYGRNPFESERGWSIRDYRICNQTAKEYLESVCPGLYDALQSYQPVWLNNCSVQLLEIGDSGTIQNINFYLEDKIISLAVENEIIYLVGMDILCE